MNETIFRSEDYDKYIDAPFTDVEIKTGAQLLARYERHTHDDRYYTESETDTKLSEKAASSQTHTKAQISDFPTLGTASSKDVASSGNASTSQVVMGNDTRLTDSRKASDVSAWAKASTKPSYTPKEVGAVTAVVMNESDYKKLGSSYDSNTIYFTK